MHLTARDLVLLMRRICNLALALIGLAALGSIGANAQAALLMEEPYGFFGRLNPTGHNAIYFERICAETPVQLRRCHPGEPGAVISRYQGINGYDWIAIPLVPYLYSVEDAANVPVHVDREIVTRLRDRYREAHLLSLGLHVSAGNLVHGGWTQLIGVAYERRIYAFRFETTEAQDDALIEQLNAGPNQSRFNLLYSNCADFARQILSFYFPHSFHRSIFPDAGMTSPKQLAHKLTRYGHKHPDVQVAVFEIPQVPGYRRQSHANKNIDESFVTTIYAVPITFLNPYAAGGLLVDYLFRGRYHLIPKHPEVLGPEDLDALTQTGGPMENSTIANMPAASAASASPTVTQAATTTESGLGEVTTVQ